MTQTPLAPNNQVSPPGYATGVPGAPVTGLAAGDIVGINYPATPAGGSPVPTNLPWVILLNSSPFTLLVTSGGVVRQIAAFTADLIFVIPQTAPPLVVLAQSGGQIISPGSDTTIYTTWYEAQPPGQFPAALGSGAINTQISTQLDQVNIPLAGVGAVIKGPYNVAGFGAVRATIGETSSNGPVQFLFSWLTGGAFNAPRLIGIEAGGVISVILPNLTDNLQILVSNNTVAHVTATLTLHAYTPAFYQFDDESLSGPLLHVTQNAVVNGGTMVGFMGASPGPAKLSCSSSVATAGLGWSVKLDADTQGDNSYSTNLYQNAKVSTDQQNKYINDDLMLVAVPMRLTVSNGNGANTNFTATIVTDSFRAG